MLVKPAAVRGLTSAMTPAMAGMPNRSATISACVTNPYFLPRRAARGPADGRDLLIEGGYLIDAIYSNDYPVVQGAVLIYAFIVVLVSLTVDLTYSALDPRVKI